MAKRVMGSSKGPGTSRGRHRRSSSPAFVILSIILVAGLTHCGHKGAPLAKDRLRPRLMKAASLNNRQVLLTFSEAIDLKALTTDDIKIAADSQALKVLTFYPSLSDAEIVFFTEPQAAVVYEVTGAVYDSSENKGVFKARITGSIQPDTLRPAVKSVTQGGRKRTVTIQFDKAMDTVSAAVAVLPKKRFKPAWRDIRTVNLVPSDSGDILRYDTTYYFLVRDCRDLSGNRAPPIVTRITPDTVYKPILLRGKAEYRDTLCSDGLVFLSRGPALAVARIDRGEFLFEVRDSLAFFADAVRDGLHGRAEVRAGQDNRIDLAPEEFNIDSLIN